jgi:hypothetical protein
MEYRCDTCNYVTDDKSNHRRHMKSKNHLDKEVNNNERYICNICNYETTSVYNHNRHKTSQRHLKNVEIHQQQNNLNIPLNQIEHIKQIVKEAVDESNTANLAKETLNLNKEAVNLNKEAFNLNKESLNLHKDTNDATKKTLNTAKMSLFTNKKALLMSKQSLLLNTEILNTTKKTLNTNISVIKYLTDNHKNNPVLNELTDKECKKILLESYDISSRNRNFKLQRTLLRDFRENVLIRNIITTILSIIKKENPNEQSIYNCDSSRLNYVIKESIENWKEDKSGVNLNKLIIDPIMNTIEILIQEFYEEIMQKSREEYSKPKEEQSIELINICINNTVTIMELLQALSVRKFDKIIIRDLAPHLRIYKSAQTLSDNILDDYKDMPNYNKTDNGDTEIKMLYDQLKEKLNEKSITIEDYVYYREENEENDFNNKYNEYLLTN